MTSSKGTIVYIGRFALPDRNAAAHRVTGNARIFSRLGYRTVLLGGSHDVPPGAPPQRGTCNAEDVEAWQVAYPDSGRQWIHYCHSIRSFEQLLVLAGIDDLRMVVCYNHPAITQARLFERARRLGAAAVADVTEWYSQQRLRSARAGLKNADNLLRMHWAHRRAQGLIVTSEFIAEHYRDLGVPMLNLPTIYPTQAPRELAVRPASEPPRLFFAGTGFTPADLASTKTGLKDRLDWVVQLLAAAQALGAEFRQLVYGVTREQFLALLPHLGPLIDRLGDRLAFRGRVPHRELQDDLFAADFSIFFRKATRTTLAGFPSKLAESITFGTPVITNPMPNTSPFVEQGRTGFLIDIHDRESAAARLKEILSLPPERIRAMKQECQASRQFAFETYLEPTRAWLDELIPLSEN